MSPNKAMVNVLILKINRKNKPWRQRCEDHEYYPKKSGKLVTIKSVTDENDLMIINKSGITIRLKVADVRIMGRATQGVRLINLEKRNDQIGSVCKVTSESLEDEVPEEEREGNIPSDPETNTPVNETEE